MRLSHVNRQWQCVFVWYIYTNVIECLRLRNQSVRLHASLATEHQCDCTTNEKDSHVCCEKKFRQPKIPSIAFIIVVVVVVVVVVNVQVCVFVLSSMLTAVVVYSDTCHHAVCYVFLWIFIVCAHDMLWIARWKIFHQDIHKYTEKGRVN